MPTQILTIRVNRGTCKAKKLGRTLQEILDDLGRPYHERLDDAVVDLSGALQGTGLELVDPTAMRATASAESQGFDGATSAIALAIVAETVAQISVTGLRQFWDNVLRPSLLRRLGRGAVGDVIAFQIQVTDQPESITELSLSLEVRQMPAGTPPNP